MCKKYGKLLMMLSITAAIGVCIADAEKPEIGARVKPANTEESRVTIDSEPKNYAWWLRAHLHPVERKIRDIPVSSLNSSWVLVSEWKKEFIPRELLFENGSDVMELSKLAFFRSGDFNKDGIEDLAVVGTYLDQQGKHGSFILVLTKSEAGGWQNAFFQSWEGGSCFLALGQYNELLSLWSCMECDASALLIWDEKTKTYSLIAAHELVWIPERKGKEPSTSDEIEAQRKYVGVRFTRRNQRDPVANGCRSMSGMMVADDFAVDLMRCESRDMMWLERMTHRENGKPHWEVVAVQVVRDIGPLDVEQRCVPREYANKGLTLYDLATVDKDKSTVAVAWQVDVSSKRFNKATNLRVECKLR